MATATAATGNGHKARPNATSTHTDTEASTVSQLLVSKAEVVCVSFIVKGFGSLERAALYTQENQWILFAVQLYNFIHLMLDAALISFHAWLIVSSVSFFIRSLSANFFTLKFIELKLVST